MSDQPRDGGDHAAAGEALAMHPAESLSDYSCQMPLAHIHKQPQEKVVTVDHTDNLGMALVQVCDYALCVRAGVCAWAWTWAHWSHVDHTDNLGIGACAGVCVLVCCVC